MLDQLAIALLSLIKLFGLIVTATARTVKTVSCDVAALGDVWAYSFWTKPRFPFILSFDRWRFGAPALARIPRDLEARHRASPTREVTFLPPRLK